MIEEEQTFTKLKFPHCPKCNEGDARPDHGCPFLSDVYDDYDSICNCCDQCCGNCADDI